MNQDEYKEDKNGVVRDAHGRLAPGQVLNPKGRPKREIEAEALTMLSEEITPQVWRAMVKRLAARVLKDGDVSAFRALADYYAGKPTERVEMSTPDNTEYTLVLPLQSLEPSDGATPDADPVFPTPDFLKGLPDGD